MQAKDIPELPILEYLHKFNNRTTWFKIDSPNSLYNVVSLDVPDKVLKAKMSSLIKRGLVKGCACGCRGDFEITDKGIELITKK